MSYLATGLDLKFDTLSLAGEPATGSEFDDLIYEWLTVVERAIVSGGTFGPTTLQPADWYWARAWPRGALQMVQPYNQAETISAIFTSGSTTITVGSTVLPDLSGYRIMKSSLPARHVIDRIDNSVSPTQIILREGWTGASETTDEWVAYPDTYELPADFVRGLSPLFLYSFPSNIPTTQAIDVIEATDLERMYPQTFPWGGNISATVTGSGLPVLAARVDQTRIRFSHFLNTPSNPVNVQLEFEYLRRPPVIAEGTSPQIPIEHRRILSYGAAFLILQTKNDSMAPQYMEMFLAQWRAMRNEHARSMRRMSTYWGVVRPPRASGNRAIMLTETGLPIYVW